jgi:alpha-galactosidase
MPRLSQKFIFTLAALLSAPWACAAPPLALTPPMGWNSWDCFGTTVTEAQTKANTDYMATYLAQYGWKYIVVDIQWYEPNGSDFDYPARPQSNIDAHGRLWPVTNKHPSAANGLGFKPLADYVHGKGLKFGIHLMRGIPRRAWTQNTSILGTPYFARDIARTNSTCPWNPDMYGVDMTKPGAQEYYNSVFALIASWAVDFVKVDDLSRPYHQAEIEGIRKAIENSGRPMVLSTSPGATPLSVGGHVMQHANMWRISDDFWDNWQALYEQFKRLHDWTPYRGAGHWPDGDMLPLGNVRAMQSSNNWTRLTTNEQRTLMTVWSIARSPLIMGGHLPNNDAFTLSMLTNREVIAVNQASSNNRQLFRQNDAIAWTAEVPGSLARYIALINADSSFDEASALFDSGVINRSTPGRSTNIAVNIAGASTLRLVVTDGGDHFGWDHADWGYARILRPDGSSNRLADLNWVSATSGWNSPVKKNQSIGGNPLVINGVAINHGIGTHANSVIEYNLPPGLAEFRALAGLDDEILSAAPGSATNATVRFMIFTNAPTGRAIEVSFASLGINEPVLVRDLWLQSDVGIFTNSFRRHFVDHASGLFKFTPVSAAPKSGAAAELRPTVLTNRLSLN